MQPHIAIAVPTATRRDGERRGHSGQQVWKTNSPLEKLALRYVVPRVTFEPLGVAFECAADESVFTCARRHGILIPTACNGKATCGLCRVKILAGESALQPISHDETKHLGNTYFITKLRLSCQLRPTGDITVRIPDMPEKLKKK